MCNKVPFSGTSAVAVKRPFAVAMCKAPSERKYNGSIFGSRARARPSAVISSDSRAARSRGFIYDSLAITNFPQKFQPLEATPLLPPSDCWSYSVSGLLSDSREMCPAPRERGRVYSSSDCRTTTWPGCKRTERLSSASRDESDRGMPPTSSSKDRYVYVAEPSAKCSAVSDFARSLRLESATTSNLGATNRSIDTECDSCASVTQVDCLRE